MYKFEGMTETDITNQYIKRLVPVSMARLPQIAYYEQEVFVDLPLNPNYMISNFGRLYSKGSNMILLPNMDKSGFLRTEVLRTVGTKQSAYIHDLVMMTFAYRPDYESSFDVLIKHVNENRTQNIYCPGHPLHNLEYSDSYSYLQYITSILPKDEREEFRPFPFDRRYLISNRGKVFSLISNSFIKQKIEKNGYCRISLADGKMYNVHRLVMITFDYRPDYEMVVVNHKDGDKQNNVFFGADDPETNLEWSTDEENRQHAVRTGLIAHGERHHLAIFKEEFVENVCRIINDNPYITSPQIAAILGIENNSQFFTLVSQLRRGIRWRRIVDKYPNICRVDHASKYPESLVREICKIVNDNPNILSRDVARILDVYYDESFRRLVNRLKEGETWTRITKEYPNVVRHRKK